MKSQIKALIAIVLISGLSQVFAADTDTSWATASWDTQTANVADVNADDLDASALSDEEEDAAIDDLWAEAPLDAASWKDIVAAPKGWVGNYVEVACDKDFFTQNACNQCFDWGKKAVGEKITGLTDSWTNPNTTEQIVYKDEQKMPELVNIGWANSVWLTNPQEPDKFWKFSEELTWTDSATG
ncbi:MAG: hypothetical protein ACD_3C00189G0003, partial [uncultured bacterium (gcode 4)]